MGGVDLATQAPLILAPPPAEAFTTLLSASPSKSFAVRALIRADPEAAGDVAGWIDAQETALAAPLPDKAASDAWWAQFWARSYINLAPEGSNAAANRVGLFPCTPGNTSQVISLNTTTGAIKTASGQCFFINGAVMSIAP